MLPIPGMGMPGMPSMGGGDDKKEAAEEDPEVIEQRRIEEEKRKEKHRKAEIEREKMRQDIRDKYGLEKKEDPFKNIFDQTPRGAPGGKKKEEESMLPGPMGEGLDKMKALGGDLGGKIGDVQEKCLVM